MTAAFVPSADTSPPTPEELKLAAESSRRLSRIAARKLRKPVTLRIQSGGGSEETISIPASAFQLLNTILGEMAKGHAMTVVPLHAELTTQQAADLLNVSRPYVIQLLENGSLPHRKVGSHRRVRLDDVMRYKRGTDEARQATLADLTAEAQALGLGY